MRKINVLADGSRMYLENAHGWNYYKTVDILNEVPHRRLRKGFGLKKGLVLLGKPVSYGPDGFRIWVVELEKKRAEKRVVYWVNLWGEDNMPIEDSEIFKAYKNLLIRKSMSATRSRLKRDGWACTYSSKSFDRWRRENYILGTSYTKQEEEDEDEDEEQEPSYDEDIYARFGVKGTVRKRILVEQNYDDESSFVYECLEPFYSKKVGGK